MKAFIIIAISLLCVVYIIRSIVMLFKEKKKSSQDNNVNKEGK